MRGAGKRARARSRGRCMHRRQMHVWAGMPACEMQSGWAIVTLLGISHIEIGSQQPNQIFDVRCLARATNRNCQPQSGQAESGGFYWPLHRTTYCENTGHTESWWATKSKSRDETPHYFFLPNRLLYFAWIDLIWQWPHLLLCRVLSPILRFYLLIEVAGNNFFSPTLLLFHLCTWQGLWLYRPQACLSWLLRSAPISDLSSRFSLHFCWRALISCSACFL